MEVTDFGLGDTATDETVNAALRWHGMGAAEYEALCACRKNDAGVFVDYEMDARRWIVTKCRLCGRWLGSRPPKRET